MSSLIQASVETLTAHAYMTHAVHDIDEMLGEGYAKAHPELIAAYMQTAAIDFASADVREGDRWARGPDGLVKERLSPADVRRLDAMVPDGERDAV